MYVCMAGRWLINEEVVGIVKSRCVRAVGDCSGSVGVLCEVRSRLCSKMR